MSQEQVDADRSRVELLVLIDRMVTDRRRPETVVDWSLGDLCNDINQFSRNAAKHMRTTIRARKMPTEIERLEAELWRTEISRIAHALGVSRQHLVSLANVADTWSSGHWIRQTNLTLAHLKRLAPIKDETLRDELAHIAAQPKARGKGRKQTGVMTIQELAQLIAERAGTTSRHINLPQTEI